MAETQAAVLRLKLAEARLKRAYDLANAASCDPTKVNLFLANARDLPGMKQAYEVDYITVEAAADKLEKFDAAQHLNRMATFEVQYYSVMASVEALEKKPEAKAGTGGEASDMRKLNVTLPKIMLPSFDGSPKQWSNFFNLFITLITDNSGLSMVEKLAYLKGAVSGEPLGMIQALPLSEANFEVAWNMLVERYDNKRLIVSAHVDALLQAPSASVDSSRSLRQLLTVVVENVSALEALGAPVNHWDMILLPILTKRLDPKLQVEWEMTLGQEFPNLDAFCAFLEKHCRAQEVVSASRSKVSGAPTYNKQRPAIQPRHRSFSLVTSSQSCCVCNESHPLYQCPDFQLLSPQDRFDVVKKHKLCLNCFSKTHISKNCPSTGTCRKCRSKHHTLLHFEQDSVDDKTQETADSSTGKTVAAVSSVTSAVSRSDHTVLLSTALVGVFDAAGNLHTVRALLDTASQASFITEHCMQKLRLRRVKAHLPVNGLSNTQVNIAKACTSIVIVPVGSIGPKFTVDVFVLPRITGDLPSVMVSSEVRNAVASLTLADPSFDTPGPIDLLIGADLFPQLVTGGRKEGPPVALDSVFGWILMGKVASKPVPVLSQSFCVSLFCSSPPLEEIMTRFWEIEEFPTTKHSSPEDELCEKMFVETHRRMEDGRYSVCLPFRSSPPEVGDTRARAIHRLMGLERRLKGNSESASMYSDFMKDYLASGHMEKVPKSQIHSMPTCYIPHHAVVKPASSTTKLRVVFDASAKGTNGMSLNDNLLTGPKLQREIIDVLLGFRLHAVVFTADIKQMYRQIYVHPEHQDYQRIVWRFSDTDPIEDYRLKTVTYGVSSAPYLALRTLRQLATDEAATFPVAARVLQSDSYVDDIVTGSDSIDSALVVQKELIACLDKGGFKLRKFMSNQPALLDWLPLEDIETPQSFSLDPDSQAIVKVLGLQWNPLSDTFGYRIQDCSDCTTKRTILSTIARIFDPLGWLSPLLMLAKHFLQVLWMKTVDWDADLPRDIVDRWGRFKQELPCLSSIAVPRCVKGPDGCAYEIHGFSDSSEIGYAAVVYLRIIGPDDNICIQLLVGKSKVAPLKVQSLPRLELCAALLLARLLNLVVVTYQRDLSLSSITAWTDSQVVLAWINSSPHQLKTFVANRVSELQELTHPAWWKHVSSEDNPADCASRGLLPTQLLNHHLWWTGPSWLREPTGNWPSSSRGGNVDPALLECKTVTLEAVTEDRDMNQLLTRFSSLTKCLRVTGFVLRFIHNCRTSKSTHLCGNLTPAELNLALRFWLLRIQSDFFKTDIAALKKNLCTSPQLRKLVPFLDEHGLLRVGGRLTQAAVPFEHKHPLVLPKTHPLTDLIIAHYHEKNHHPGVQTLRGILREQFWILSDKDAIVRCLRHCLRCFKQRPSSTQPRMGDLPAMRVQQVKPFVKSGVDYAGPFNIKLARVRKPVVLKAYLCLFVCCATKAVHLELASDLSTEVFLAAYKRFIARRGRSSDIYSDCGTNFVGASNRLVELQQLLSSSAHQEAITGTLSQLGVNWHFNPPAAPHFGGLWEAGVKSVKTHLYKVIGEQILTFEELYTVLVQVEATLNSRPLCPLSNDPNDLGVLTPGHFLTLEPLVTLPEPDLGDVQLNRLQRWQLVERLQQDFWHRWHRDYLHTLQQRQKWHEQGTTLTPNQLVLLKEDRLPPLQWRLGRIVELHTGKDGVARVATVRTTTGQLKRPVVKLCPLPMY